MIHTKYWRSAKMPHWKMSKKPIGNLPSNTTPRKILHQRHTLSSQKFPRLTQPSLNPRNQGLSKIMDSTVSLKISRKKSILFLETRPNKPSKPNKPKKQRNPKLQKKALIITESFTRSPAIMRQSMASR